TYVAVSYDLSLHDALPIYRCLEDLVDLDRGQRLVPPVETPLRDREGEVAARGERGERDAGARDVDEDDHRQQPDDDQSVTDAGQIGRAHSELQSRENLVCR